MRKEEKAAIEQLAITTPNADLFAVAKILQRDPNVLKAKVREMRARTAEESGHYLDLHKRAAEQALADGHPDVTRKLPGSC